MRSSFARPSNRFRRHQVRSICYRLSHLVDGVASAGSRSVRGRRRRGLCPAERFRRLQCPSHQRGLKPNSRCRVQRLGQMAAQCPNSRRLPGKQLRPPSGRCQLPLPLLCCPFPRRVRWREVSPRPGQRPILHSAFRALRNRPKSEFLCRCCKRSSRSYGWIVANSSYMPRPVRRGRKETFATIMIIT